ncbi:D-glycero-beta-D-manno-heptose 1-phosphate adenylyltransferase [Thermoproteota archaeon]
MSSKKILNSHKLAKTVASLKKRGKKVVFTNGCFDILHCGHTSYLNSAKRKGDILVVGVNSDSSVRTIKGKKRPINKLKDRIEILSHLDFIDYLCAFSQSTPLQLIKKVRPNILIKGSDWKDKGIVGTDFVKSYGGRVLTIPLKKGYSTTRLIKNILSKR